MIENLDDLIEAAPAGAVRERRALGLDLIEAGLEAVDAARATARALDDVETDGVDLTGCTLFAFGKASQPMAHAASNRLSVRRGIVLGLEAEAIGPIEAVRASHPVPSPDAAAHGRRVLELARALGEEHTALCLISGGGSAMLELPKPGVDIEDIVRLTDVLLERGADIDELNAVRRQLSQLKGGGLARAIAPARIVNVIISDVKDNRLAVIASGPTVLDRIDENAERVLRHYELWETLKAPVRSALSADREAGDGQNPNIRSFIAADNETARTAVVDRAAQRGVSLAHFPGYMEGIARERGLDFYEEARARATGSTRGAVFGGETTVEVRGSGRGGRNHEIALAVLSEYRGGLVAAVGTDGVDGTSEAAGALVDEAVVRVARRRGLDPERAFEQNDSAGFFRSAGSQIVTGQTKTNVADLCLYLA